MTVRDEQFTEAATERDLMTALLASGGWKMLNEFLQFNIDQRTMKLEEPLTDQAGIYLQEYMKGARQAFRAIQAHPQAVIDTAAEVIKALTKEQEDGRTDGGDTISDDGGNPEFDFGDDGDADSEC